MPVVATALLEFLEDLPQVVQLTSQGVAYVTQAVSDFRSLPANATQADVDALVDKIQARSNEIQALK